MTTMHQDFPQPLGRLSVAHFSSLVARKKRGVKDPKVLATCDELERYGFFTSLTLTLMDRLSAQDMPDDGFPIISSDL